VSFSPLHETLTRSATPSNVKRFVVLLLLLLAGVIWFFWPQSAPPVVALPTNNRPVAGAAVKSTAALPAERSDLADALNSPTADIRADLRVVAGIVDTFRTNFPRDGNPVGSNADITAALTGNNRLQLALIPPDHPAIKAGQLCDRWGTPFFFHAESAVKMEIRSAGPDKKMWTDDDVTFAP
jgi:hypothetical protein